MNVIQLKELCVNLNRDVGLDDLSFKFDFISGKKVVINFYSSLAACKGSENLIQSFIIDENLSCLHSGKIELDKKIRGNGIGKKLILARENLAKRLGLKFLIINNNQNSSFWKHLGYQNVSEEMIDYFNKANPLIFDRVADFEYPLVKFLK